MTDVVVSVGLAGVVAFLPRFLWPAACGASVVALPFTLWWCGYAAVGGGGPGYEPAVAALQTNANELSGAVALAVGRAGFIAAAAGHIVLLVFACGSAWSSTVASDRRADKRTLLALAMSALPLALTMAFAEDLSKASRHPPKRPPGNTPFTYQPMPQPHPLFGPATYSSPLGSAEEIASMGYRREAYAAEHGYQRRPPPPTARVTDPVLAIFYLGESARGDGFGPARRSRGAASRELDTRIASGLGAWLPQTCASSDGTHLSVPMLLTGTAPDHVQDAARAPTVLGTLHAAGFATAWLANNQGGPDATERGHDLYAGLFNVNPDDLYGDNLQSWKFDGDMLPTVRSFVDNHAGPRAILMHSIGSHFPYDSRYPRDFFPAEPGELSDDGRLELRYERSLEYGTRAILDVAALMDVYSFPAFLVYTSDHGENLPRDRDGLRGHLGARTSQAVAFVPSFVLWNEAMARSGRPAQVLSQVLRQRMIAHVETSQIFIALAGLGVATVEPTAHPRIWGRRLIGDDYAAIPCSDLEP